MNEQAGAPAGKAGAKVTVACKLPNGLILRLTREEEVTEPIMGGGVKVSKMHRPTGEEFRIRGNAVPVGKTPRGKIVLPGGADEEEGAPFSDGFALTPNVPKDFWDAWLSQNRDLDVVKRRLIFAAPSTESAESKALEHIEQRSGLEPLAQEGDPRTPKRRDKKGRRIDRVTKGSRDEDEEVAA